MGTGAGVQGLGIWPFRTADEKDFEMADAGENGM